MDGLNVFRMGRRGREIRSGIVDENAATALLAGKKPHPLPRKTNRYINGVSLIIDYIVGIGSILLGTIHLKDCPAAPTLPILLIAFGGVKMASRLMSCVYEYRSVFIEEYNSQNIPKNLIGKSVLFFIAEMALLFPIAFNAFFMDPTTNKEDPSLKNYCDFILYKVSFYGCIVETIYYIVMYCTIRVYNETTV